jgi:small multidrug resistance pump
MQWVYLVIAIVCEVSATTALRACMGFTRLTPSIVVIVGYGAALYFLSLTFSTIPMGVAYAVWSGVGVVLIALAGWVMYGQQLDLAGFCGIGLITGGVIVLNVFSKSVLR